MKLDKIKFARVIGFLSRNGFDAYDDNIVCLDDMLDIDVPEQEVQNNYLSNADIEMLMLLMTQGTQKIETIKTHRKLTGMGLKESKDIVERYWVSKSVDAPADAKLGDILGKALRND